MLDISGLSEMQVMKSDCKADLQNQIRTGWKNKLHKIRFAGLRVSVELSQNMLYNKIVLCRYFAGISL